MPLPTLLNDYLILGLPAGYHTEYSDALRTATVLGLAEGTSGRGAAIGDVVAFCANDARALTVNGIPYLFVPRSRLVAVISRGPSPAPAKSVPLTK